MDSYARRNCRCGCGQSIALIQGKQPRNYVLGHNRRGVISPEGWIEQGQRFVWSDGKKRPLHRLVMEKSLGRPLRANELVRHRDGDLLNNDPDNLFIVTRKQHFRQSMASGARQRWTEDEKDDAVRLYCAGMTIDEVATTIGRSYSATRRLLARWGVLRTPSATRALSARTESQR